MTGQDLYVLIQENIGHDYSAYFDPARTNDLIKQAFIKAIEIKYADITSEKNTDELFTLIKTNVPLLLTGGQIPIASIPNYLHTLAIQTYFQVPYSCNIIDATNKSPIVIVLDRLTSLRDGDQVVVSGVTGNTNANFIHYVKWLYDDYDNKKYAFQLFNDEALTVPVVGNGKYLGGGTIKRVVKAWVKKKNSYRKYSTFGEPTTGNPDFEIANGSLKILPFYGQPSMPVCDNIFMDYVSVPPVYPDVTNGVINLENSYSLRFLYFLANETALLMGEESRDTELSQISNAEKQAP